MDIRSEDIIRRPNNLDLTAVTGKKTVAQQTVLNEIKGYISQAKEIISLAKSLGLPVERFSNIIPGLQMGEGEQPAPGKDIQPAQGANQLLLVLKMLTMAYGDITVNELIVKLKEDYGNKKLSELKLG